MGTFEGYVGIRLWDGQLVDDVVFSLLFVLFMCFALVFRTNYRLFLKMMRDVVYVKERQNLFEVTRGSEWLFRNFMTFQALFLCSVCLFAIARAYGYFNHLLENTVLISIGLIMMVLMLFYWCKRCFYYLLGVVFTDAPKYKFWKTNYNAIIGAWGICLYIPALWLVFVGSSIQIPVLLFVFFYILCRFVIIYKTIRIFHRKNSSVEIDFRPFIKVEPLSSKEFRQQRISVLDHTAVIFTARTAIDHFFHLCEELRVAIPETMKYFCMTEAIAVYLQKYIVYRKRKIFYGQTGKADDLVTVIAKHAKEKYLVPVSDVHKDDLFALLDAKKINYTKAVMFRTVSNDFAKDEKFDYDMLVFFSPSGISSLLKNFPDFKQDDIKIGCFGPTTAKAVKDAGLRLDVEAPTVEAPSMTAALDLYLKKQQDGKK